MSMAKTFMEFVALAKISCDESYYRFVHYGEGHHSSQWSYRVDRKLHLSADHEDLEDKYLVELERLGHALFSVIEKEHGNRPKVCVIGIKPDNTFNAKIDYDDPGALDVGKIALGASHSYFQNNEVDVT